MEGLNVALEPFEYEWSLPRCLRRILRELNAGRAVCAVTSEGGLFEYGSDGEIVSNLIDIRGATAPDAIVVGSVTRDGEVVRASQGATRISTRPRRLDAFRRLADETVWFLERVVERPFSYNVRMAKA